MFALGLHANIILAQWPQKRYSIKFDDPDSPYLLIGRAFREKCIFMDYWWKSFSFLIWIILNRLKSCLFEKAKAKLIKHMLNSLSGAGIKKKYNLNLINIKCSNHVSKLT